MNIEHGLEAVVTLSNCLINSFNKYYINNERTAFAIHLLNTHAPDPYFKFMFIHWLIEICSKQ